MERDDDDVASRLEVVDDALDSLQVAVLQCVAIMSKGTEAYFNTFSGDDGRLYTTLNAGKLNALLL